jgi:hypothetical protein
VKKLAVWAGLVFFAAVLILIGCKLIVGMKAVSIQELYFPDYSDENFSMFESYITGFEGRYYSYDDLKYRSYRPFNFFEERYYAKYAVNKISDVNLVLMRNGKIIFDSIFHKTNNIFQYKNLGYITFETHQFNAFFINLSREWPSKISETGNWHIGWSDLKYSVPIIDYKLKNQCSEKRIKFDSYPNCQGDFIFEDSTGVRFQSCNEEGYVYWLSRENGCKYSQLSRGIYNLGKTELIWIVDKKKQGLSYRKILDL